MVIVSSDNVLLSYCSVLFFLLVVMFFVIDSMRLFYLTACVCFLLTAYFFLSLQDPRPNYRPHAKLSLNTIYRLIQLYYLLCIIKQTNLIIARH